MKPSLVKLQKYFNLEAERGYDNHAVVGGLDRILDRWEAEARAETVPEDLIQVVVTRLRDYPRLATASREEVLQGLLRRIQNVEGGRGEQAPRPKPPARPAPQSASSEREREPKRPEAAAHPKPAQPRQAERSGPGHKASRQEKDPTDSEDLVDLEPGEATQEEEPVRTRTQTPQVPKEPGALKAPVTVLPGVGKHYAQTLARLGLNNLRDMLYYFPRRYDDYSQLKPINRLWYGEEVTVIGTVQTISIRPVRGGQMKIVEAVVSDGSGALRINWFNQVHQSRRLRPGSHVVLSGKVEQYLGRLVMNNPETELMEEESLSTNRIVPVYSLTASIGQRWLRKLMHQVVMYWAPRVPDPLPDELRSSAGLVDLSTALLQAHFPDTQEDLDTARHRLAFDEIFLLQLGVLRQKRAWQERTARAFSIEAERLAARIQDLPFGLTAAQQRAVEDIRHDLASGRPMNRLIQGDVGSGKTVVAALAAVIILEEGAQVAFMAPTSILAEQHYQSMLRLLAGEGRLNPEQVRLLVGATPEPDKREIREGLANGTIKVVVGTHALIEDPVTFQDLELVVVDEQHRFGVEQRAALRSKGANPHLLVMTATPIPRSLALTVYGDLDLSIMDELPPGRQPVSTHVLPPRERERAYSLIRNEVSKGRQAFIIYPLVEESDKSESRAAVDEHARLQSRIFPDLRLGLLHGRMKPEDKDAVMQAFRAGDYDILVSTTVIEVGVDVPNATVMLIEGANRFGLAQLHQLRGRVGRGAEKSYCLLIPEAPDEVENERLQVMAETNDGFVLAEKDLEQRGPGQFLGVRQSGYSELQLASLTDMHLIEKSRRLAQQLFERDPNLSDPSLQLLAETLERFWGDGRGDIS